MRSPKWETCLPLVSVSVQGLACPGGGNKLLLLFYHWLLIVNCVYCLTWGGGGECGVCDYLLKKHQVLKAWLPVVGRKGVLVLCCLTPLLWKYHRDKFQWSCPFLAATSFLHPCSSGKSLFNCVSCSPFLPEKSLSSLEIKEKTGGGNKWMLRSRKQSIK